MKENLYTNDYIMKKIDMFYQEHHPEMLITRRIKKQLQPIIEDGIKKAVNGSEERINNAIDDFLGSEKILSFVKERQPNVLPVPDQVMNSIIKYFSQELVVYEPILVYRSSNSFGDENKYMIIAQKGDGKYACWSSWNQKREVLNFGHYDIDSLDACKTLLMELFTDISDETEHYGFHVCEREFEKQILTEEKSNIVYLNRSKGR